MNKLTGSICKAGFARLLDTPPPGKAMVIALLDKAGAAVKAGAALATWPVFILLTSCGNVQQPSAVPPTSPVLEPIAASLPAPAVQPVNPTAPEPAAPAPEPVVPPKPAQPAAFTLIGKTYHRAFVLPQTVFNGWAVVQRANLDADSGRDFLMLGKQGQMIGVLAVKGSSIGGVTYKYTVIAEAPLALQYQGSPIARCHKRTSSDNDVLAAVPANGGLPVWAIQSDDDRTIRQLTAAELDELKCNQSLKHRRHSGRRTRG